MKKVNLTSKIFLALILGVVSGLALHPFREAFFVKNYVIDFLFNFLGTGFIRAIRMIVVPLVFCSLTVGAAGIEDIKKLGRVGIKTVAFYLGTTAVAITLALGVGSLLNPGKGVNLSEIAVGEVTVNQSKPFVDILLGMIPINPIEALAKGDMLQIIVFAILCGVAMAILGDKVSTVRKGMEELNNIILKVVEIIMKLAPLGVFGLIGKTFATLGYVAMLPLLKYFVAVVVVLLLHYLITYQSLLILVAKYSPIKFLKKFSGPMMVAFSTSSSSATLPASMETLQKDFGVSKTVSSFTLPLGSTINMDGTAIMQGVATIFIAQIYGVNLSMGDFATVILTATLASIGTAGVPGVGVIMLGMVLQQVGLPLEGMALVMGIDRFVDMFRTVVNITGDAICTLIVARTEGEPIDGEVTTETKSEGQNEMNKLA
ncbi:dicarboxylate/amino acid:cation symporter [uncultured Cetobacterium sp.]|uniref:dicarboxylate/amino acid:cation symporter n=1 Tax=uncultured Cetobacterium sp. TaxID=527638 RepID=UPI0026157071|nr:dicarboxylate/amino acid:cation symporter [uncultured Cetobacterium sp.]